MLLKCKIQKLKTFKLAFKEKNKKYEIFLKASAEVVSNIFQHYFVSTLRGKLDSFGEE